MRQFESEVDKLKYLVLKETAMLAKEGKLNEFKDQIPYAIIKGSKPNYRCCVYKERVIVVQRVRLASGEIPVTTRMQEKSYKYINKTYNKNKQVIFVIEPACEQCPINRFQVTEACKGCLAHNCVKYCSVGAIKIVNRKAVIDYDKCVECGRCREFCPFGAVSEVFRPCMRACSMGAIKTDEEKKAVIDEYKCNNCGLCTKACPFGAIGELSEIIDVIEKLKTDKKNIAIIAPSIISQFNVKDVGTLKTAIKMLGFDEVVETNIGADKYIEEETENFKNSIASKGCLISSHCNAFANIVKLKYPELIEKLSNVDSPMIQTIKLIKNQFEDSNIVFLGTCIAKKSEKKESEIVNNINVLTYEELDVLFDVFEINIKKMEKDISDEIKKDKKTLNAKKIEIPGGISEAIEKKFKDDKDLAVEFNPIVCDGIEESIKMLNLLRTGRLSFNYLEGMSCKGGCIGAAGAIIRE